MAVRLDGQVALVTGAGRGLGRAYALDLAKHGAKVVINDFGGSVSGEGADESPAQQVVNEIKAMGGDAIANGGDVGSYEDCYNMIKLAMDTWGRLDAVVANAGILRDLAIHNMAENDWDMVIRVHLKQCYNLAHHVWPVFRQRSYGRFVMATSTSGLIGNFGQGNYGAAKAGMYGLMNVLKLEGEKYNINVNLISPGAATRMTNNLMGAQGQDADERAIVMGPEHVAPAVTYLSSPQCQESGVCINASGGHYSRIAIVRNNGVDYDPHTHKDADWFEQNWGTITDLTGAYAPWSFRESREQHYAAKKQG
ncbi:MAG: SDR family NAD(P)-dependent oxidoreductase [Dehalococcoidia bacterium]|nr:SDR family NAD(P)-dependent oxidoreductase [Dehalococcoidia bacterium]